MAVTVVELPRGQSPLRVGTPVRFAWGTQKIEGIIIEDRGAIGVGGRRLYGVKFQLEYDEPRVIELPLSELEVSEQAA